MRPPAAAAGCAHDDRRRGPFWTCCGPA
jgi:hypothetical protein